MMMTAAEPECDPNGDDVDDDDGETCGHETMKWMMWSRWMIGMRERFSRFEEWCLSERSLNWPRRQGQFDSLPLTLRGDWPRYSSPHNTH